jgi:hypothetical protein
MRKQGKGESAGPRRAKEDSNAEFKKIPELCVELEIKRERQRKRNERQRLESVFSHDGEGAVRRGLGVHPGAHRAQEPLPLQVFFEPLGVEEAQSGGGHQRHAKPPRVDEPQSTDAYSGDAK